MKITFYPKKSAAGHSIYCRLSLHGSKRFPVGLHLADVRQWDFTKKAFATAGKNQHPEAKTLNKILQDKREQIEAAAISLQAGSSFATAEAVVESLHRPQPKTVMAAFEMFCQMKAKRVRDMAVYRHTKKNLLTLHPSPSWGDFHEEYLEEFFHHFLSAGLKKNTLNNRASVILSFLRWAYKKKYNPLDWFEDWSVGSMEETEKGVLVSIMEMMVIDRMEVLSNEEKLVREMYVFLYHTGRRISEAKDMRPEWRVGDVVRFKATKTSKAEEIPLSQRAGEIFDIYEGRFPYIETKRFNQVLRVLAKRAGMNKEVFYNEKKRMKWEVIGSKSARKSFATYVSRHQEGGIELASQMLSHSDTKTTMTHYLLADIDHRREVIGKLFNNKTISEAL